MIRPPNRGWDNRPLGQRPWTSAGGRYLPPNRTHIDIMLNGTIVTNIGVIHGRWDTRDHNYGWYDWGGQRVCHHYDNYGFHWWGFYQNDVYFWTRYHNDRYWWWDPYYSRWCYLHEGRWWWQDPVRPTIVYIYNEGAYSRYEPSNGGVVLTPDTTPPTTAPPPEPSSPAPTEQAPTTYYSKDGSRMVQIFGADKEAFLYDTAAPAAFEPQWLAKNVDEIRFRFSKETAADGGESETLREILVLTADGGYETFDPQGDPTGRAPLGLGGSGAFEQLQAPGFDNR